MKTDISKKNPLAAYLAGEATEEQASQVESWMEDDEMNQELYSRLADAWDKQAEGGDNSDTTRSEKDESEELVEED